MFEARLPPSPVWGGLGGGRVVFAEDRGAAHPDGMAATAVLAEFEQVAALNWT
jgi:hypothetical protein